jgi:hypothetical protein
MVSSYELEVVLQIRHREEKPHVSEYLSFVYLRLASTRQNPPNGAIERCGLGVPRGR